MAILVGIGATGKLSALSEPYNFVIGVNASAKPCPSRVFLQDGVIEKDMSDELHGETQRQPEQRPQRPIWRRAELVGNAGRSGDLSHDVG